MGKIAGCLKKDPNCPRSPNMAKLAVDMAKQGKGLPEILAAIDEKQKPAAGAKAPSAEPPAGPKKITPSLTTCAAARRPRRSRSSSSATSSARSASAPSPP